jgi:hypothetical protein
LLDWGNGLLVELKFLNLDNSYHQVIGASDFNEKLQNLSVVAVTWKPAHLRSVKHWRKRASKAVPNYRLAKAAESGFQLFSLRLNTFYPLT